MPVGEKQSYRFGPFELDTQCGQLRSNGVGLKLQGQPVQILEILLEKPGQLVTREQLRERLWASDTFVDFDHSLNTAIKKLRLALGDEADTPHYIETLPRRGYRFIGEVALEEPKRDTPETVKELAIDLRPPQTGVLSALRTAARVTKWSTAKSVGLGLGILVSAIVLLTAFNVGGWRQQLLGRTYGPRVESLAVLPLANLSGDPQQDYFADGMTEALIAELGQIGSLRVISRTSVMQYKGAKKSVAQIARDLSVDAVIEGSVLRAGNRIRITAQLIAAVPERHLWARSYERELQDVLSLQGEIAQTIANEVRANVSPGVQSRLASARQVNPQAHDAYLQGLFFFGKTTEEGYRKAVEYAQRAVQIDPNYAQAYGLMALSYWWSSNNAYGHLADAEAAEKTKAAAMRALEIDDSLAEPHIALAAALFFHDWDWPGAERHSRKAIDLNPNSGFAHTSYAWYLAFMGRQDESVREAKRGLELDPFSPHDVHTLASMYYFARQYDQALVQIQKCTTLFPDNYACYVWQTWILEANRMYDQEVPAWQKAKSLRGEKAEDVAALGRAYKVGGITNAWRWEIESLKSNAARDEFARYRVASLYALLGEKELALGWLQKAYAEHDDATFRIKVDPNLDSLRSDPRFQDLLHRMNFPQ